MTQNELWRQIDDYFEVQLGASDELLERVRAFNAESGLPAIDVSPLQGQLLGMLLQIQGARRVLEVGTLGGYSTICMARALPPHGRIVTLELEPAHAAVARKNFERAGIAHKIALRVGNATELLPRLHEEVKSCGESDFDFAFIDADKQNNPVYFDWATRLVRPGGVIVIDNVVRDGEVINEASSDPDVIGTRRLIDRVSEFPNVRATAIQTVGKKDHDGYLIVRLGETPSDPNV